MKQWKFEKPFAPPEIVIYSLVEMSILFAYILEEITESSIDRKMFGKDTSLIDTLKLRLMDVLRNSRDHGIEYCQADIDEAVFQFETWLVTHVQ